MKTAQPHNAVITAEERELLASKLWERANRPHATALDFWSEAEQQIIAMRRQLQHPPSGAAKEVKSARPASARVASKMERATSKRGHPKT